jgi:hypothetical protein
MRLIIILLENLTGALTKNLLENIKIKLTNCLIFYLNIRRKNE